MQATCYSKVAGRQAVCRAEAWPLHNIIHVWPGGLPLEINVDATYSLSGMDQVKRGKRLRGVNADIWSAIHRLLEGRDHFPIMVKVKSHAAITQVLILGNTITMLAVNELADVAAGIFSDHRGDRHAEVSANREAEQQLKLICRGIVHIQAGIWRRQQAESFGG